MSEADDSGEWLLETSPQRPFIAKNSIDYFLIIMPLIEGLKATRVRVINNINGTESIVDVYRAPGGEEIFAGYFTGAASTASDLEDRAVRIADTEHPLASNPLFLKAVEGARHQREQRRAASLTTGKLSPQDAEAHTPSQWTYAAPQRQGPRSAWKRWVERSAPTLIGYTGMGLMLYTAFGVMMLFEDAVSNDTLEIVVVIAGFGVGYLVARVYGYWAGLLLGKLLRS